MAGLRIALAIVLCASAMATTAQERRYSLLEREIEFLMALWPGSDQIGVHPGWIRLQCDLDTPKMRRFQYGLRPDS